MSQRTEAQLLHDAGAAYRRRVGLVDAQQQLIFAGIKPGVFSLYLGEEPHYHYDPEGRWQRICLEGVHYLKALDGSASALERVREGHSMVIRRRDVPYTELSDLNESARQVAVDLLEKLGSGKLRLAVPPAPAVPMERPELIDLLDLVSRNDAAAWFRYRESFLKIYGARPNWFLPPSCPQPIVLQVSKPETGARNWLWGSDQESVAKSDLELEQHCQAISKFLGKRAAQARGLVLADGEALRRDAATTLRWLETATRVFPLEAAGANRKLSDRPVDLAFLDGVYSCLNSPGGKLPDAAGWKSLHEAHLRRVEVGVVSGDSAIRQLHGLSWSDQDLTQLVTDLKSAGIGVGLVVPIGAGGVEHAAAHLASTARLLSALPLSAGDLVYLVDIEDLEPEGLESAMASHGLVAQSQAERDAQKQSLREALAPLKERKVKVVPYTVEKQ